MAYINKIVVNGSEVNANQLEGILDKDGHQRFIEGNGTNGEHSGISYDYSKWSLSGSHLMLVLAGTIDANALLPDNVALTSFELPEWIRNKIYTVAGYQVIEAKEISVWISGTISEAYKEQILLQKTSTGVLIAKATRTQTASESECKFRIQFDLLIDNA